MATINAKLINVPTVVYVCGNCGRRLGSDEVRTGMNISKGKLYLYDWYAGRCPGCGAKLKRPEADDCTISHMTATM